MVLSKDALKYTGFVLGISWLYALAFYLGGFKLGSGALGTIMPMLYMLIPALTVFVLYKIEKRTEFKQDTGIRFTWNRWFVLAWFAPIVVTFLIIGVNMLFPEVSISMEMAGFIESQRALLPPEDFETIKAQIDASPIHPLFMTIISAIGAGITINALLAFGEELFWRGYLYNQLKEYGFWKISLITGFVWGIWHAPLIMMGHNYPNDPILGILLMTIWTMLLAPSFTFIRQKSGSVLAPAILHGVLNASAGIPILLLVGGQELLNGWLGLAGFLTLLGINILLYFVVKAKKFNLLFGRLV